MKKEYVKPVAKVVYIQPSRLLEESMGEDDWLGKERKDDYSEGGDSPIWGDSGNSNKLW